MHYKKKETVCVVIDNIRGGKEYQLYILHHALNDELLKVEVRDDMSCKWTMMDKNSSIWNMFANEVVYKDVFTNGENFIKTDYVCINHSCAHCDDCNEYMEDIACGNTHICSNKG